VLFTPGLHEIGGAAQRSRLLAEGLARRGWDVRVVARSGTTSRLRSGTRNGVRYVEIPGFGRRGLGAALYVLAAVPLGLWWGASVRAFLAVQLSAPSMVACLCGAVWSRPFLSFTSTTGPLSEVTAAAGARSARLRRRVLRRARFLVAQTAAGAEEFRDVAGPDRIAVLPTPVDGTTAAPPLDGRPRAVFVGRLASEKNLERLLDAWRAVVARIPDARLTMVGEGGAYRSVEDVLRNTVERDPVLTNTVAFTGWVDDPMPIVSTADVFVLPSHTEGMSNALLEALARERVVVASDIPGNRSVLGDDYPLLFEPTDTESLARMLIAALTDDAVRDDVLARLRRRAGMFELDTVTEQLASLIEAACTK
jgi:glycosyltransferase involved in cell wall biosynthesis